MEAAERAYAPVYPADEEIQSLSREAKALLDKIGPVHIHGEPGRFGACNLDGEHAFTRLSIAVSQADDPDALKAHLTTINPLFDDVLAIDQRRQAAERKMQAAERQYSLHWRRALKAGRAMLKAPVSTPAELRERIVTFLEINGVKVSPKGKIARSGEMEHEDWAAVVEAMLRVPAPTSPVIDPEPCARAEAEWRAAKADYEKAVVAFDQAHQAMTARAPRELVVKPFAVESERWHSLTMFDNSPPRGTPAHVADLRRMLVEWLEARTALPEWTAYNAASAALDDYSDRESDREFAFMHTPAGALPQVLAKMEVIEETRDIADVADVGDTRARGFESVGYCCALDNGYFPDRFRLQVFRDLCRIAGWLDHPALTDVGGFDPEVWVGAIKQAGARATAGAHGGAGFEVYAAEGASMDTVRELLADVADSRWKRDAVQIYLDTRRRQGSDPFYDHLGEWRRGVPNPDMGIFLAARDGKVYAYFIEPAFAALESAA
ncbi:MAG: hypothetical protein ACK4RV_02340 [Caulobacter sp.]